MSETDSQPHVSIADMEREVQEDVMEIAVRALEGGIKERDIAQTIKKEMDERFGATWHVIVGRDFGSYVTHESGNFLYFSIGERWFLVFKAGV